MARIDDIQLRRDTAANWTSVNPTLDTGEVGLETDTLLAKVGDGSTAWTSLSYSWEIYNVAVPQRAAQTAVKTANYNAVIWDLVRCDPSGGTFTVTLPTAVGKTNKRITIKNTTNNTTTITIATTGGQTIDGASMVSMTIAYQCVVVESDGANWMVI